MLAQVCKRLEGIEIRGGTGENPVSAWSIYSSLKDGQDSAGGNADPDIPMGQGALEQPYGPVDSPKQAPSPHAGAVASTGHSPFLASLVLEAQEKLGALGKPKPAAKPTEAGQIRASDVPLLDEAASGAAGVDRTDAMPSDVQVAGSFHACPPAPPDTDLSNAATAPEQVSGLAARPCEAVPMTEAAPTLAAVDIIGDPGPASAPSQGPQEKGMALEIDIQAHAAMHVPIPQPQHRTSPSLQTGPVTAGQPVVNKDTPQRSCEAHPTSAILSGDPGSRALPAAATGLSAPPADVTSAPTQPQAATQPVTVPGINSAGAGHLQPLHSSQSPTQHPGGPPVTHVQQQQQPAPPMCAPPSSDHMPGAPQQQQQRAAPAAADLHPAGRIVAQQAQQQQRKEQQQAVPFRRNPMQPPGSLTGAPGNPHSQSQCQPRPTQPGLQPSGEPALPAPMQQRKARPRKSKKQRTDALSQDAPVEGAINSSSMSIRPDLGVMIFRPGGWQSQPGAANTPQHAGAHHSAAAPRFGPSRQSMYANGSFHDPAGAHGASYQPVAGAQSQAMPIRGAQGGPGMAGPDTTKQPAGSVAAAGKRKADAAAMHLLRQAGWQQSQMAHSMSAVNGGAAHSVSQPDAQTGPSLLQPLSSSMAGPDLQHHPASGVSVPFPVGTAQNRHHSLLVASQGMLPAALQAQPAHPAHPMLTYSTGAALTAQPAVRPVVSGQLQIRAGSQPMSTQTATVDKRALTATPGGGPLQQPSTKKPKAAASQEISHWHMASNAMPPPESIASQPPVLSGAVPAGHASVLNQQGPLQNTAGGGHPFGIVGHSQGPGLTALGVPVSGPGKSPEHLSGLLSKALARKAVQQAQDQVEQIKVGTASTARLQPAPTPSGTQALSISGYVRFIL